MQEIPPVAPEHVIAAHEKVMHDRVRYGWTDMSVSVVTAVSGLLPPKEILHVLHRLYGLTNYMKAASFLGHEEFSNSLAKLAGGNFHLSQEALLRAVARAPLFRVDPVKEVTFSRTTFLPIILEEAHAVPLVPEIADADVPATVRA